MDDQSSISRAYRGHVHNGVVVFDGNGAPPEGTPVRIELLASLTEDNDVAVGERGLCCLTESTRDEDWSPFYPPNLRESGSQ